VRYESGQDSDARAAGAAAGFMLESKSLRPNKADLFFRKLKIEADGDGWKGLRRWRRGGIFLVFLRVLRVSARDVSA
jgi:hypothetical protein